MIPASLGSAALLGAGMVAAALLAQAPEVTPRATPASTPAALPLPDLSWTRRADSRTVLAPDLFAPTRGDQQATPASVAKPQAQRPEPRVRLIGVFLTGTAGSALLSIEPGRKTAWVELDGTFAGFRLVQVDEETATLSRDGKTQTISLESAVLELEGQQ